MTPYTRLVAAQGDASASLLVSSYYMIFAGPVYPRAWEVWTSLLAAAIIRRGGDVRKIEWHCEPVSEPVDTVGVRVAFL